MPCTGASLRIQIKARIIRLTSEPPHRLPHGSARLMVLMVAFDQLLDLDELP